MRWRKGDEGSQSGYSLLVLADACMNVKVLCGFFVSPLCAPRYIGILTARVPLEGSDATHSELEMIHLEYIPLVIQYKMVRVLTLARKSEIVASDPVQL
jgi:hypothetical protein